MNSALDRTVLSVSLSLFLYLLTPSTTMAQNPTGTIFGIATDASGAVVPRVSVSVKNVETGASRKTFTGESGEYRVTFLPVGNYQVTAELSGFKTMVRSGLKLEVQQILRADIVLQLGELTET